MYFKKPGIENTTKTLEIVINEAKSRAIKHLIVASTFGNTASEALKLTNANFVPKGIYLFLNYILFLF